MEKRDNIFKKEIKGISSSPPLPVSIGDILWNRTGSWRYLRPEYRNKVPPCTDTCPSGGYVERQIKLLEEGKVIEAWNLLREENPFPAVCGRVCFHPCEYGCSRKDFDQPVSINAIERFIGDRGLEYGEVQTFPTTRKERIGIVGAGPSGLTCAYYLKKMGYDVTVFESRERSGGILRYGIPGFRLPKDVLDAEISLIEKSGVRIENRVQVGRDLPFGELRSRFDSVFIGAGLTRSRVMGIEGEAMEGVMPALDFLTMVNSGEEPDIGRRVVVIGGGNTAIDASTVALRLGAEVKIFYRRTEVEMPAFEEEVKNAKDEGVELNLLSAPVRIHRGDEFRLKVEMIKMTLGEPDESGRKRPVPLPGSNFTLRCDTLLTAIGEEADLRFLDRDIEVKKGKIFTREDLSTTASKIYAGGDIALPDQTVTHAIGSGKKAAIVIDSLLRGNQEGLRGSYLGNAFKPSMKLYRRSLKPLHPFDRERVTGTGEINLDYFRPEERMERGFLSPKTRVKGFEEARKGLSDDEVRHEIFRCFHCGNCTLCDNCFVFCPDMSVRKGEDCYSVDYDYCKGCGLCASECPRSAITLLEEGKP